MPVVAASRARGEPKAAGTEVGGRVWLADRGVLRASRLAPEKARVRLALALGVDQPDAVRAAFAPPPPRVAPPRRPAPARTPPEPR
jgi:L-asparaginase/Glu-tRNA(Gln) amidotransferase subunit D